MNIMICVLKILVLANVFENFRKMCLEFYELNPARFLSASGLPWQAALKKTKSELEPYWYVINRYWYVINRWKMN